MAAKMIFTQTQLDELEIDSMVLAGDYVYYLAGSPERLNLRGMLYYLREGFASLVGGGGKTPEGMSRYIRPRKKMGWHLYGGPSTNFEGVDRVVEVLPLPVTVMFEGKA